MFRLFSSSRVTALARVISLAAFAATEAVVSIGPDGGTIELDEAGLVLTFPPGALSETHEIHVRAHSDLMGFEVTAVPPLPATLGAPVTVSQEIHDDVHGAGALAFAHVDSVAPTAQAKAFIRPRIELLGKGIRAAVMKVWHFSGYLLASGINAGEPCDPNVVTDGSCVWVSDGDGGEGPR